MAIIRMTEEEYEQTYGKPAPWSTKSTPAPTSTKKSNRDLLEQAGDAVNTIFPGKEIGKSLVQAGTNVANLATGGVKKFQQGLDEGNRVNVPALIGDYGQAALMTGGAAAPIARAKPLATMTRVPFGAGRAGVDVANLARNGKNIATAKNIGTGLGLGYAGDVATGLKEGESMQDTFTPGLGTALGGVGGGLAGGLTKEAKRLGDVPDELAKGIDKATQKAASRTKTGDFALDFTSPKITKGLAQDAIKQGSKRVKEQGLFGETKLLPNDRDKRIADAVRDVISPKKRLIENVDAINKKISATNQGVKEYIAQNNAIFNEAQLRTKLAAVKEEHDLLFAGDKSAQDTYDAVINAFLKQIQKKDTVGLFEARQDFDKFLRTKIPNLFKKDATGQFLDPRDSIRNNAALDVRKAANEYIAELLPEGNQFREDLLRESDMLEALTRIAEKNAGKISLKNMKVLAQKYPMIAAALGTAAAGAIGGLGAGVVYAGGK